MKHFLFLYITLPLLCTPCFVHGIEFNFMLNNQASLDLYVYKAQPENVPTSSQLLAHNNKLIAHYSFSQLADGKINLRQALYSELLKKAFVLPSNRSPLVSTIVKDSPFKIAITPAIIEDLTGTALDQVYVILQQRMYRYDSATQSLVFDKLETLLQKFYSVTDIISVQASGLVNRATSLLPTYTLTRIFE